MKLTLKYPVYPTRPQEQTLDRWLDPLCDLQNSARHDRIVALEVEDRFVTLSEQQDKLTAARETYDDFREVPQDFQNHALRRKAAAAFRGERWVTPLDEARNTNEARDAGLQEATQLTLFDALTGPKSLGLGS